MCQYRPGYFSGFEVAEANVSSLDELLVVPFIAHVGSLDSHAQWSWAHGGIRGPTGETMFALMSETKDGGWWVIAGIEDTFGLPEWSAKRCRERKGDAHQAARQVPR